jgi:hypothetical protein
MIRDDTGYLDLTREWFGRPLWERRPKDGDAYFGWTAAPPGSRWSPPADQPKPGSGCRCAESKPFKQSRRIGITTRLRQSGTRNEGRAIQALLEIPYSPNVKQRF